MCNSEHTNFPMEGKSVKVLFCNITWEVLLKMICLMVEGNILTPGRYVGIEDDGIPLEEKLGNITAELAKLFAKSRSLEEEIRIRL